MKNIKQICIVGTGLLGGSIGLGLRKNGYTGRIVGVGRRAETLQCAKEKGCIDHGTSDMAEAVKDSQLLVLATPLGAFDHLMQEIAKYDHDDLVITDVGSSKAAVCDAATKYMPNPGRFVGSHPMAGSEQQGPGFADADLFVGKPCVLTPQPNTDVKAIDIVEGLWVMLGMNMMSMSPKEHDTKVAHISHLPHALAMLLVNTAANSNSLDIASTGFADCTRVASGDPQVWLDIFQANRKATLASIDLFVEEIQKFRTTLANEDVDGLMQAIETAKSTRDLWGAARS